MILIFVFCGTFHSLKSHSTPVVRSRFPLHVINGFSQAKVRVTWSCFVFLQEGASARKAQTPALQPVPRPGWFQNEQYPRRTRRSAAAVRLKADGVSCVSAAVYCFATGG